MTRSAWAFQGADGWIVVPDNHGCSYGRSLSEAREAALAGLGPDDELDVSVVPQPKVTGAIEIEAPAGAVWDLVADLPRMGDLSPENVGGRWLGGASEASVGARFAGRNRRGRRSWSGIATVTECDPGRAFSFDVAAPPPLWLPLSTWSYTLTTTGPGCVLTETWTLRIGRVMRAVGPLVTGERDRIGFTQLSIQQTLAQVKQRAEASAAPVGDRPAGSAPT